MRYSVNIFIILLSWVVGVHAGEQEHHDHGKSHGVHVHGVVELMLALEGDGLEMMLESPAMNLVGFEHKAVTPEEKQAVQRSKELLKSPQKLFSFNGTSCHFKDASVDVDGLLSGEVESHGDEHAEHAEITAHYHFKCGRDGALNLVSVALFERFPAIEKLKVTWVTESQQGTKTIEQGDEVIRLR